MRFVAACYALKLLVRVVMFSGQACAAMHLFWVVIFSTCCANYSFSLSFSLCSLIFTILGVEPLSL